MIEQYSIEMNVVFLLFSLVLYFGTRALLLGAISPQQKRDDNGKESSTKESSSESDGKETRSAGNEEQTCP